MEEHLLSVLKGALSCPVQWGFFRDGEAMPRATITRMSGAREHTLNTLGLMRGSVQIDCWGAEFDHAIAVSREVQGVLEGYRGGPIVLARLRATRDSNGEGKGYASRVSLTFFLTYRA